ncbi:MAG: MFS transporter [Chloroflexi bacterium]|nr:MFS transporter [Chloroflexota bacterium]
MDGHQSTAQGDAVQRRAFGAFRHRDFQLFWTGSVIAHTGAWMQQVAQSWLVYLLTGSPLMVGLNGLFQAVPFIAVSLYAGTVVDRVDRKKLLLWVEGWNAAVVVVVGVLVVTGQVQVWHIYVSSSLHAVAGAFQGTARQALLPHLVPRADLMTAVSLNSIVRKGSQIFGPALGGIFVALYGVGGTYFIHAAANAVLLWCLVAMRATNHVEKRVEANPLQAIVEGLRYVRGRTIIGSLLLVEAAMSAFGSYHAMMVIFAKDVFGMGADAQGLLLSAAGAGSVIGSFALAGLGDVRHKGRLLVVSGLAYGASLVAFAFCPWYVVALPILALVGGADIVFGATRTTILQLTSRPEMLGRVMSLSGISMRGLGNFGGFQTGAVASLVGVQAAVAIGAILCVAMVVGTALRVPTMRRFVGEGEGTPEAAAVVPAGRPTDADRAATAR